MTRTDEIAARLAGATAEHEAAALALRVAREWQSIIAGIAADVVASAEVVRDVELNPGQPHPFYAGKLSLLRLLRNLADSDVERYAAGASLLAENAQLRTELTRLRAILREETAAERELAALLEATEPGDAGRIREAEARLERAYRERDGVQ